MNAAAGPAPAVVSLRGLRKRYGAHAALAGIDLELGAGEIVGVVGPDGAGKTTLLRAVAGLLDVEAEEARVLGVDLRGDVIELKAAIGYVPQVFSLQPELSVLENLRFTARLHRLPAATFAARADALLARTGLAPFGTRPAGALSGGMKQKLAVANALLAEPALLLLDEATAGVDVVARAEIWALLRAARAGALVLLSTSYLEETAACDRLVYLDRGRVVASGTPAELARRVGLVQYRVWGDDPRAIAGAARRLPYVANARGAGRCARLHLPAAAAPPLAAVLADLRAVLGSTIHLGEESPPDMESTLLALARAVGAGSAPA